MAGIESTLARKRRNQRKKTNERQGRVREKRVAQPQIIFTGNRRNDRYQVIVGDKIIEMPLSALKAMIDLALARHGPGNGYTRINPVVVFRLRRAIDNVVGPGMGKALIETGAVDEYRLTMPRDQLASVVALSPCFFELVDLDVVPAEQASELQAALDWSPNEIQTKSKSNRK
jgi:hypothetical protein